MTQEFQAHLLRYVLQTPQGFRFLPALKPEDFDSPELKVISVALKMYYDQYAKLPSHANFLEHLQRTTQTANISPDQYRRISSSVGTLFEPLPDDVEIIHDTLIAKLQQRRSKELLKSFSLKLSEQTVEADYLPDMVSEITEIASLPTLLNGPQPRFLLRDLSFPDETPVVSYPTPFPTLNKAFKTGGFHPPQLITFQGAPKVGKTTLMINMATWYVRKGHNVLYIDLENGEARIRDMFYQSLLGVSYGELVSGQHNNRLRQLSSELLDHRGGDFIAYSLPSYATTFNDIKALKSRLKAEGIVPKILILDHIDNMSSLTSKRHESNRHRLLDLYVEAKGFCAAEDMFILTLSHENEDGKLAEARMKSAHADTIIRLIRDQEVDVPLGQLMLSVDTIRDGETGVKVILDFNPKTAMLSEARDQSEAQSVREDRISGLRKPHSYNHAEKQPPQDRPRIGGEKRRL